MKLKLEQVPMVVNGALYAGLGLALVLIVANFYVVGTAIAAVVAVLNYAMKRDTVKAWVIEKLTGIPRETLTGATKKDNAS